LSLLLIFSLFWHFSDSKAFAGKTFASQQQPPKKSYQKAYGRFFAFLGLCQNRWVNVEHNYATRGEIEGWAQENALSLPQANGTEANDENEAKLPRS